MMINIYNNKEEEEEEIMVKDICVFCHCYQIFRSISAHNCCWRVGEVVLKLES